MKKLFTSLLILAASSAFALDVQVTLACDNTTAVISSLSKSYGEEPVAIFHSSEDKLETLLLMNGKTKTWTMITISDRNDLACVIASGKDFFVKASKNKGVL